MVLARRLLATTGGSGSFTPPLPTVRTITSAPAGGWTQAPHPVATESGGVTFFGYARGDNGDICARSYTAATDTTSAEFVLHAALEVDTHDAPAVLVRSSDQRLVAVYTKHDSENHIYQRISTNPADTSAWAAETQIHPGSTTVTYPTLLEFGGSLWLFYRDEQDGATTGVLCYVRSTDNGATWGGQVALYKYASHQAYWVIRAGATRVDFLVNDGHPVSETPALYHFSYDGSTWRKSDGTDLGFTGAAPLTPADITQIDDGSAGPCSPWDIARVGSEVVASYTRFTSYPTDLRIAYARWNGSTWATHHVVAAGSVAAGDGPGSCLEAGTLDAIYTASKDTGQWEIARRVTGDAGATWTTYALTTSSATPNIYPTRVHDWDSGARMIWFTGSYTSYLVYSVGVKGYG